jgi:hypothetical protein
MHKVKLWMPVCIGLIAGQVFAEGERPFTVVNTLRVGYSDNLYRSSNDESGTFVTDMLDLSFRAALSERTDMSMSSRLTLLTDQKEGGGVYPNIYVTLNHSVSPRLLLSVTEYFKMADKSGGDVTTASQNARYDYFQNILGGSADYVLTDKDRLTGTANYSILKNDEEIEVYDQTSYGAGLTWKRELTPERTFSTVNLRQNRTIYDNIFYQGDEAYFDQTDLSAGLNHTFNQQWQGSIEAGVGYVAPNYSADSDSSLNPLFNAGLVYNPSPRTRLTGDFSLKHEASDSNSYGGQNTTELRFGAQHDLTAKLMVKATARFANVTYDGDDGISGTSTDETKDVTDLNLRLSYKLNRIHFLEAGVQHQETNRDTGTSWSENRMDIGWRVELN